MPNLNWTYMILLMMSNLNNRVPLPSLNVYLGGNKLIMPLIQISSDPVLKKRDGNRPILVPPQPKEPPSTHIRRHSFKRYEVQNISLADIHHLNLDLLRRCINERGKIYSAYQNGLPAKYQRAVRTAVIRARYMALLPYVPAHRKTTTALSHGGKNKTSGPEKR